MPSSWRNFAEEPARNVLAERLGAYAREQRWYQSKAVPLKSAQIEDVCWFDREGATDLALVLLGLDLEDGAHETYFLPLRFSETPDPQTGEVPSELIAELQVQGDAATQSVRGALFDASRAHGFAARLLELFRKGESVPSEAGQLSASLVAAPALKDDPALEPRFVPFDQSNSTILYGSQFILKLLRKVEPGSNVELEVGRFLASAEPRVKVPRPLGALEISSATGSRTLAILSEFVENRGSAWSVTLEALFTFFERVLTSDTPIAALALPLTHAAECDEPVPEILTRLASPYFTLVHLLAERTAELHRALGRPSMESGFGQEPFTVLHQHSLYQTAHTALARSFARLREGLPALPPESQALTRTALSLEAVLDGKLRQITQSKLDVTRIRCHGDYHLGQVLFTGDDFVIIDFEGEPGRSPSERRDKRSPLRDVAGMLRSFAYAADSALSSERVRAEDRPRIAPLAEAFRAWACVAFVRTYLAAIDGQTYAPQSRASARTLLSFFELEKAIYEVNYELNNRPAFIGIPLTGLQRIAAEP